MAIFVSIVNWMLMVLYIANTYIISIELFFFFSGPRLQVEHLQLIQLLGNKYICIC